jgi:hypothetical protein
MKKEDEMTDYNTIGYKGMSLRRYRSGNNFNFGSKTFFCHLYIFGTGMNSIVLANMFYFITNEKKPMLLEILSYNMPKFIPNDENIELASKGMQIMFISEYSGHMHGVVAGSHIQEYV